MTNISKQNAVNNIYSDLYKQVRCASTAIVVISTGLVAGQQIDGITLVAGDLVLLKNQTAGAENGIYVVSASPARWVNYNSDSAIRGSKVLVKEGTTGAGFVWACGNTSAITVGSTSITYTRTFLETIQSNLTLTVNPTGGGDFTSTIAAFTWLNQYAISGNATVTIQGVDAVETATTGLTISHPNWQQIKWNGLAAVDKTLQSVVSSSGSTGNYSYVLQLNDNSGITTSHFFYAGQSALSGGVLPEYLTGCYEITNIGASNQITILSTQYDTNLASGNVTGTVQIIKTVYKQNTASTGCFTCNRGSGLAELKNIVFLYGTPATPSGNGISLNGGAILSAINVGVVAFNTGIFMNYGALYNNTSTAVTRCQFGIVGQFSSALQINNFMVHGNVTGGSSSLGTAAIRILYGASCTLSNSNCVNNNSNGLATGLGVTLSALGGVYAGNNGIGIDAHTNGGVLTSNATKIYRNVSGDVYANGNSYIELVSSQTITGTVTNGANTVTSSDTSRLYVGARVSGTNIPANTTVAGISSATAWTMSNNATPGSGAVTITVKPRTSPAVNAEGNNDSYIAET